jgi:hypothetical protein
MRADQPVERDGGAEGGDVGAPAAHIGLQLRRQAARMRVDPFELARQEAGLDAAIGQDADRRRRQQHQDHHRGGEANREAHGAIGLLVRPESFGRGGGRTAP